MKTKTFRKLTAIVLAVMLTLSMCVTGFSVSAAEVSADAGASTLYLKPNNYWSQDNPRYAAYFFEGATEKWVDMTDADEDGVYEVAIPDAAYKKVIFCRMNPKNTANGWNTKWNQTNNLPIPTDSKTCYVVTTNTWDKGGGTWVEPTGEPITSPTAAPTGFDYSVAGDKGLCGVEWDPTAKQNAMSDEDGDGVYEITFTGVAAGAHSFKVTDGSWSQAWGGLGKDGNYEINLTAVSDVTIVFDSNAKKITSVDIISDTTATTEPIETTAPAPTDADYYLFGYINGADYADGDDHANLGEYKFVDGKLTVEFTELSYVGVKTNKDNWYMTDGWAGTVKEVTLKNTKVLGTTANKLPVPAGEVTFTLVANADDTLTLSYTSETDPVIPTDEPETTAPSTDEPGTTAPADTDYYLFGYINGADYADGDDHANLGEYKFVDGKLTVEFTELSYVGVKTNKGSWYMTDGWAGTVKEVTLKNTEVLGETANKLPVPAGEVTFTLVVNDDDTLTLSYTSDTDPVIPTDAPETTEPTESTTAPADTDYYLFGFINGADYADGDDHANLGDYKFVDGKLTVEFTELSYVGVKTNKGSWYMTDGWAGTVKEVTLKNTEVLGTTANKLPVPEGKVTFTLVVNADDTLTLSYTSDTDPVIPTDAPETTAPQTEPTTEPTTEATEPTTEAPTTEPATTEPTTEPTTPADGATLYMAAPVFKEGNTWDDVYLAYSSNSNVSKATKIAMTKTDNYYYASGALVGSLSTNSNWAVYSVTLTKEQIAAIDAVNYAGFVNSYNSVMTSYIWANSIFRANVDNSGYKTAKTSVADLDGKMFVINGATTLDNKKGFTGNWVSGTGNKKAVTIYSASPIVNDTTTMGDMYFRYGVTSNVASATQIRMMKTNDLYTCTAPQGTKLKAGQWVVYKLDLTEEQVAAIDKCNYTGFTSAYGAEIRTQFSYSSSVTRANVGTSGYKSAKTPMAQLDGKMFFITSSAADNTVTYLGNWGEYDAQIKTVTIKVAVPTTVGTKAVKDLNLVYSDSSDIKEATFLKMTATDETFTPDATHTSLIANNAEWTVYTITIDADQVNEIQKVKRCGFSTSDRSVRTGFSWSYNVLRAGIGEYENPFDTTTTATFYDLDGSTFVMNGSVIDTNPTTLIGYWK